MGEVALPDPERFQPMEFGDDYVLGLWTDKLCVQYVRKYPVRK